jgi:hypothetical protein
MVRVHSLPVMEGVTCLAPQREAESRNAEGHRTRSESNSSEDVLGASKPRYEAVGGAFGSAVRPPEAWTCEPRLHAAGVIQTDRKCDRVGGTSS